MLESEKEPKIEISGTDEKSLTFILRDEDHTMGNALRYVLVRNPEVKFCGYSVPHPSENIMKVRLETFKKPATDVFRKAILDLKAISNHMRETFSTELLTFEAMQDS